MLAFGRFFLGTVGLATLVYEYTLWPVLRSLGRLFWSFSIFGRFESLVARMSPGLVVAAFFLPLCAVSISLKFGEFWLFEHGHIVTGVASALIVKVWGVSFSARLFEIARPKMLEVAWFNRLYGIFERARTWVLSQPVCQKALVHLHRLSNFKASLKHRLHAIMPQRQAEASGIPENHKLS